MKIFKKEYRVDNQVVDEATAVSSGIYSICFLDENDKAQKIEMMDEDFLFKVIYLDQKEPFDSLFKEHEDEYPELFAEFWSFKREISDKNIEFDAFLYNTSGEFILKTVCVEDSSGKLLTEIEYTPEGEFIGKSAYFYNEDKLEKVEEYNINNKKVSELILNK